MLVQTVNAGYDAIGEAQLFGDTGSAFASNLNQRTGILLLRGGHLKESPHAL